MPERFVESMLLMVTWGYTLLCCAFVPLTMIAFWLYHPVGISEKILAYFAFWVGPWIKRANSSLPRYTFRQLLTFLTTLFFGLVAISSG